MPTAEETAIAKESMTRAEAARAAIASARLSGQPLDARTEEILLAWGAGLLTDSELDEYAEEMKAHYSRPRT